ncbi:MAG TPA: hypothetical protein VK522_08030 [Pseudolabrys sp.]|nr:hypothetical protein [Pseudolabrys sp.]
MTKLLPIKYSEMEASARFDKPSRGALNASYRPLKMTATLKRRALKKRPSKPEIAAQSAIE